MFDRPVYSNEHNIQYWSFDIKELSGINAVVLTAEEVFLHSSPLLHLSHSSNATVQRIIEDFVFVLCEELWIGLMLKCAANKYLALQRSVPIFRGVGGRFAMSLFPQRGPDIKRVGTTAAVQMQRTWLLSVVSSVITWRPLVDGTGIVF